MPDHNIATRLLGVVDGQIDKNTGSKIDTTYGQVFGLSDSGAEASVYLAGARELAESDGGTPEPSEGYRIPGGLWVEASDYVRVDIDARGHRWISEVLPSTPWPKIAIDVERGQVLTGDGLSPPGTTGFSGDMVGVIMGNTTGVTQGTMTWDGLSSSTTSTELWFDEYPYYGEQFYNGDGTWIIPEGLGGWYYLFGNISGYVEDYGTSSTINIAVSVEVNGTSPWDGITGAYMNDTRFMPGSTYINGRVYNTQTSGLFYLEDNDVINLRFAGSGDTNPIDFIITVDNFTMWRVGGLGATGATGEMGPEGPAGPPGDTGAAGADGADGDSGSVRNIEFTIDGGGVAIGTGIKGDIEVGYACTITAARMFADQSGSIVVNIWKDTYANYPPVVGDKITASAPPTISSATKSENTSLTGWTTSISAGDILRFNVDSASTITRVTVSLTVTVA